MRPPIPHVVQGTDAPNANKGYPFTRIPAIRHLPANLELADAETAGSKLKRRVLMGYSTEVALTRELECHKVRAPRRADMHLCFFGIMAKGA